jgi:SAM-dependent methyltransferase
LALALSQISEGCITGVDLSTTMVRAASRRNRTALDRGQLRLLRGDIANLPFRDNRFDKIFSIHTFYFWPEPRDICAALVQLLAHGGRLVSTFATAHTLPNRERVYWHVHRRAEALVKEFEHHHVAATLAYGPDSRQFNNVAIVIDKLDNRSTL